ncbi:MAG: LacI family DNA-binding transcriptional regulator [Propionicimonas sp.]|nr:LacI family DNA-binding transcriptional regulator [Propionicimonas sp.]
MARDRHEAGPARSSVSIRDVAALAGVSVGAVSNTINHPEMVRRHTRAAVEKAISELGFVPNQQARVLTGASSQVIGLIVLDIMSPFFMEAASAVERAANEAGHVMILCDSENSRDREAQLLQMLSAQRVRGVLLTPATAEAPLLREWLGEQRLPLVFLDYRDGSDTCSVSADHVAGAKLAVRHLLDLGHDRIAFVGGPTLLHQFAQRSQGARAALVEAGLDPARSLIEESVAAIGIRDGMLAAERLLARGMPGAVFCGNDMLAFGVYRGLAQAGVRVPEDVALVGYDDITFAADWIVPLTSVRQPIYEIGYRAANLLLEHSAGDESHVHQNVVLPPSLVVRASSDPAAR